MCEKINAFKYVNVEYEQLKKNGNTYMVLVFNYDRIK